MRRDQDAPGLVRRQRKTGPTVLYWSPQSFGKQARCYPSGLVRLPDSATDDEVCRLCQQYTTRLMDWIADKQPVNRNAYDGSIGSLCRLFARHEHSPMQQVKFNTAKFYSDSLKVIEQTVAARAVRAVVPIDARAWFDRWAAPATEGGPQRQKRAHAAISMLRQVLRFGQALGYEECGKLADGLAGMRFERAAPRRQELTLAHVKAFIEAATASGNLSMAIGVATQFELMVRQKDVIGEYPPGERQWRGSYTWEEIGAGGFWRLVTSKTAAPATFDLTRYDLLWPLIQAVPQAERTGAIVKDHTGKPMTEGRYRKKFRALAEKAGIPRSVWNMDSRAGGVTEAFEAGAPGPQVADAATHADEKITKAVYRRRAETAIAEVAEFRRKARQ